MLLSLILFHIFKDGWTPFHLAAREGDVEIMQILLEKNRQIVLTTSKNGRTPLHTACLHGRVEAVKLILLQNFDDSPPIDLITDSCLNLPIMDTVRAGSVEILELLTERNPLSIYQKDISVALHIFLGWCDGKGTFPS